MAQGLKYLMSIDKKQQELDRQFEITVEKEEQLNCLQILMEEK